MRLKEGQYSLVLISLQYIPAAWIEIFCLVCEVYLVERIRKWSEFEKMYAF